MKQILYGLTFIVLMSCTSNSVNSAEGEIISKKNENKDTLLEKIVTSNKNIEPNYMWISENFEPYLDFTESGESVWFVYLGQCMYKYPIFKTDNSIEVKYDTIMDCMVDIGFKKNYGVKTPKVGEVFIKLKQIQDTIIANYLFSNWTDSINSQNKLYPLFPEKFIRTNLNVP